MNYLIDTNVVSEIRKGERCDRNVTAWYRSVDDNRLFLSVIVLGEIRRGIERVQQSDPSRAQMFAQWLEDLNKAYADRILSIDRRVADEWGRMTARRPTAEIDVLLAATAKANNLTLATRNLGHVAGLGADVLNPFEFKQR